MPPDTVTVWRIPLDGAPSDTTLSPDERQRAARFHFPRDRQRWTNARAALRAVLAQTLGIAPAAVDFAYSEHGKPRLASGTDHARLRFNLSHAGGAALLALTSGLEVGVDIECERDNFDPLALAAKVFAPDEIALLQCAPPAQRFPLFFTLWTAKEAVVKAHGAGLILAPASFSIAALAETGTAHALSFTVQTLPAPPGFAAALAVPLEKHYVCWYDWHDSCIKNR